MAGLPTHTQELYTVVATYSSKESFGRWLCCCFGRGAVHDAYACLEVRTGGSHGVVRKQSVQIRNLIRILLFSANHAHT